MKFSDELRAHYLSGASLLYIQTPEENRVILDIADILHKANKGITVKCWSITDSLVTIAAPGKGNKPQSTVNLPTIDKLFAFLKEPQQRGRVVYILKDANAFFKMPLVIRQLRDLAATFRTNTETIILVSPQPPDSLPLELQREYVNVEYALPDEHEIRALIDETIEANKDALVSKGVDMDDLFSDDNINAYVKAASGLTSVEAENAFSKSIILYLIEAENGEPTPLYRLIAREKAAIVNKTKMLEYFEPTENIGSIGGLDILKEWITVRSKAFSKRAREFGLPSPKGIIMVGLPGCGKSLVAKAASSILNVPAVKFDVGSVFGGLVGQSEQQMRQAIQFFEKIGPSVIWVDEAEKAFAGVGGGGSNDSGTTKRVFGTFLTWMQEKKGEAFVIMTVNDIGIISQQAPELLRRGRFDEIFFVGLPNVVEREAIINIHVAKVGRDPSKIKNMGMLAELAVDFSGAEIESAVIDAMFMAFYDGGDLNYKYLEAAISRIKPLAVTQADALKRMKSWAEDNAVHASSPMETAQKQSRITV